MAHRSFRLVVALLHLLQLGAHANPPIIHYSHNMRILKIPSNTEIGSIVYRIKATDADNENIFFDVLEDYGKSVLRFDKINHNEANVVLITPLEEKQELNLTIYATDNQESTYIESRLIATSVPNTTNSNSYLSPIVVQHNPIYVFENETLNKSITVVRAFDREDSKLPVTFELLDNSDLFDFHYVFGPRGMSTAELVLIGQLDFERQNLYILSLLAINAQTDSQVDTRNVHSVQLSIVVRDVQDSAPVFHNLPAIVWLDNSELNSVIFTVSAQDGDTVDKRQVKFAIQNSEQGRGFKMTNNGSIFLPVSHDELNSIYSQSQPIQLEIQATEIVIGELLTGNESISAVSNLIVCFVFTNQAPRFKADHLIGRVNEHSQPQSSVSWQVNELASVMDLDQGLNGTIELEVVDPHGTFIIEPSTAYRETYFTLLVNDSSMLDYEARQTLSVIIVAKDKSKETPLQNSITCTIHIDDINDNYPQFSEKVYHAAIYENAPEGTSIIQIMATDKDQAHYGEVRFTAIKGFFAANLQIDALKGIVSLANSSGLDRELVTEYVVSIEARDNRGNGNQNTTELHIRVLDVNDNPPIFLQSNYLGLVDSEVTRLLTPLQLTAIDIDEIGSNNSVVNYEILYGNYEDLFFVDRYSGKMEVKQTDHLKGVPSSGQRIVLTMRAYDLGIPQMWSSTQVYIYILNPASTVKASFFTMKKLNPLHNNESLQKVLNDITGGNVTVTELRGAKQAMQRSSIIASVQYRNESTIDLDAISALFDHLQVIDKPEREIEVVTKKSVIGESSTNHELVVRREIRTTQLANLDILLWIMIFLILFLLVILLYLLYLLCRDRRYKNSKTVVTQTEMPNRVTNQTKANQIVRIKKRKARQARSGNKVVDVATSGQEKRLIAVPLEDRPRPMLQAEYEVQEEKYTSWPNMVSYYKLKRLRYPTNTVDTPSTVEVLSLPANEQLDKGRAQSGPHSSNQLHYQHSQLNAQEETKVKEVEGAHRPVVNTALAETGAYRRDEDNVRMEQHNTDIAQFDTTSGHLEMLNNNYRNMQRKSIFTITYDKINSRENISAGSDKVN